jgi:APA family basic amino acid/polyamine antiporter
MSGDESLFVREATGLVREWSSYDAWIYAFLSVNIVTLGFYIWTFNSFIPAASPIFATIIAIVVLTLQNVIFATLIAAMPRVGGDYVWQSRLLGGVWGMFLSWPGWVFALWLWVPIYGSILSWLVFGPISALFGYPGMASFWNSSMGLFVSSMIVVAFVFIYVSLGMKWYARIQQALFYIGVAGMVLFVGGLLTTSPSGFQTAFDAHMAQWGVDTTYQGVLSGVEVSFAPLLSFDFGAAYQLFPMLLFWIMWTVWGATLFGEVREAGEFKKMFGVLEAALIAAGVFAMVLWPLFDAAMGYEFYQSLNYLHFVGSGELQWLSSPTTLAAIAMGGGPLAKLMAIMMAGWFFAWSGTVFLSSTRVIFATAFDRAIPDAFAAVKGKYNAPINAILLMAVPSLILTVIYFFVPGFQTLTLDATFAIAITYFGTTIAGLLLPYRRPDLFSNTWISRYEIAGVPLVTIVGGIYAILLLSVFYLWATKAVYGINNVRSAGFMVLLYVLSAGIYFVMKWYRKKQGVNLDKIHSEIPTD